MKPEAKRFIDMARSISERRDTRPKPITAKAQVLQQFRGMSEPEVKGCARKVGDVLKGFSHE